jgi:phosphotransferase system  glucose/maltose/N-acetylglucosamine-specific IIC component
MALLPEIDRENILESLQTWGPLYIWVGMVTAVIPPFLMPSMFKDWVEQKAKERQEKKRNQEEKEKKRNQEEKMEKIQSDAEASTAGEPRG